MTKEEDVIATNDPVLGAVIEANGAIELDPPSGFFEALTRSIISQQISVKAAAKIYARFCNATNIQPEKVLTIDETMQKEIGLSGQKLRYLQDLALHFVEDSAVFNHLENLSDDDVITELTRVKGIGVWTAQMFLIFTLHRPDVFAPDDRGLQLAIQKLYELPSVPKRTELDTFAEKWAPYRSTASLHLWRTLNNTP